MPTKKLSLAVYIGRFQPLHNGHLATLEAALLEFDYILILIGSSQESRTFKNPWTYRERKEMLKQALTPSNKRKQFKILPLPDFSNDQEWLGYINNLVTNSFTYDKIKTITAIGYTKDHSSYYLNLLPWPLKEFKKEKFLSISSTHIRKNYFSSHPYQQDVAQPVALWLEQFKLKHPRIFKSLQITCAL